MGKHKRFNRLFWKNLLSPWWQTLLLSTPFIPKVYNWLLKAFYPQLYPKYSAGGVVDMVSWEAILWVFIFLLVIKAYWNISKKEAELQFLIHRFDWTGVTWETPSGNKSKAALHIFCEKPFHVTDFCVAITTLKLHNEDVHPSAGLLAIKKHNTATRYTTTLRDTKSLEIVFAERRGKNAVLLTGDENNVERLTALENGTYDVHVQFGGKVENHRLKVENEDRTSGELVYRGELIVRDEEIKLTEKKR